MASFMTQQATHISSVFDAWLTSACEARPERRRQLLTEWEMAPAARLAHPREEHLLPLMVVAGAAGDDIGRRVFADQAMGATIAAYAFGRFGSDPRDDQRCETHPRDAWRGGMAYHHSPWGREGTTT